MYHASFDFAHATVIIAGFAFCAVFWDFDGFCEAIQCCKRVCYTAWLAIDMPKSAQYAILLLLAGWRTP
jgi:hypothetical protein